MTDRSTDDEPVWVGVTAAAALRGVAERTVWRWINSSRVTSRTTVDGKREILVSSLDIPPAKEPTDGTDETEQPEAEATDSLPSLAERLKAAEEREQQLLLQLAALRPQAEEAQFLRQRVMNLERLLEGAQQDLRAASLVSERAEHELRVLVQQAQQGLQQEQAQVQALETERQALKALPSGQEQSEKRPWWKLRK